MLWGTYSSMGKIKHLLSRRETLSGSSYKHFVMEAAENIHLHWRDTRINLYVDEMAPFYKYVKGAYEKMVELGFPSQDDRNINLGDPMECKSPGYFNNIASIEEQEVGGVHIHIRDTRIHIDQAHFMEIAYMFKEALINFLNANKRLVKLDQCTYPAGVTEKYLDMLDNGDIDDVDASLCGKYAYDRDREETLSGKYSDTTDRLLLSAIYASIKQYGYADGPFHGEYAVVWEILNKSLYFTGAHRYAVLKKLGYNEIYACVIPAPHEGIVREENYGS